MPNVPLNSPKTDNMHRLASLLPSSAVLTVIEAHFMRSGISCRMCATGLQEPKAKTVPERHARPSSTPWLATGDMQGTCSACSRPERPGLPWRRACCAICCTSVVLPVPVSPTSSTGSRCAAAVATASMARIAWPVRAKLPLDPCIWRHTLLHAVERLTVSDVWCHASWKKGSDTASAWSAQPCTQHTVFTLSGHDWM